jgi:hypothetical protein
MINKNRHLHHVVFFQDVLVVFYMKEEVFAYICNFRFQVLFQLGMMFEGLRQRQQEY